MAYVTTTRFCPPCKQLRPARHPLCIREECVQRFIPFNNPKMTQMRDPRLLSSRDPYPFPKFQNDDDFMGSQDRQKLPYDVPPHLAQHEEPWSRLNKTPTLSSARHEIFHFDMQAPRDSLDFILKAKYNQHEEIFRDKNETLFQPETTGDQHGRVLKNRVVVEAKKPLPMNHPLSIQEQQKKEDVNSVKLAIDGCHTQTTNKGFSRKPDGGFFCS